MIGVIGLDHHVADAGVRGRLCFAGARRADALRHLAALPAVDDVIILSTCQRTEVYAATGAWLEAKGAVSRFLAAAYRAGPEAPIPTTADAAGDAATEAEPPWNSNALYALEGTEAARHALRVAAGLRSAIPGEAQILGQVKEALSAAEAAGVVGEELRALFVHAVRAGKRARAETSLGRADDSLAGVAVRTAGAALGGLAGETALVIGTGRTGRLCAHLLRAAGVERLLVANRSPRAAADVAAEVAGEPIPLEGVASILGGVGVIISATSSPRPMLDAATLAPALEGRRGPLVIVDLAVPADVERAVGRLPRVTLYPLDALRGAPDRDRAAAIEAAEAIVEDELRAWTRARQLRQVGPAIAALRQQVDHAAQAELTRVLAQLGHLPDADRRAVERFGRRLAGGVFHLLAARVRTLAADESLPPDIKPAIMAHLLAAPVPTRSRVTVSDHLALRGLTSGGTGTYAKQAS